MKATEIREIIKVHIKAAEAAGKIYAAFALAALLDAIDAEISSRMLDSD